MLNNYINYIKESNHASKGDKKSKTPDQKMILSNKFKDVLTSIQNMKQSNISKRLLEIESVDRLFDISYIDIDDDGENITYLQSNRIERLKKENKSESEFWTSKMRTKQKIGRFIKQILPKFNEDSIQKFTKKFKTIVRESEEEVNFELVDGDDIIYWYDGRNYENDNGTLGTSCMGEPGCGRFLNCYRNNPNQCKLLIFKNKSGDKIRGSALIWYLSTPKGKIFMDRVYVNDDNDEMLFVNYAKRKGWLYKDEQKYGGTSIVIPGKGSKEMKLEVILDNTNYYLYPYVDTLRYFYPDLKTMANHENLRSDYYTLTDTDGRYEEWSGDDNEDEDPMVYDGYNNKNIPESRATWCRYDNSYISSNDAVRLSYNNEYAFPDSPHIVYSEYTKKFYAKEDCDFSEPLKTWVWKKYSVDVYKDKNKKIPPDKIHRFELNKSIGIVGNDYYDINILNPVSSQKVLGKDGKYKTEVKYVFK